MCSVHESGLPHFTINFRIQETLRHFFITVLKFVPLKIADRSQENLKADNCLELLYYYKYSLSRLTISKPD